MAVEAMRPTQREDLLEAVERTLWRYEPVRSRDLPLSFELSEAGVLTVRGYAPTLTIKEAILGIAGSVDGITEVVDEVYADPDLENAIAGVLARNPKCAHLPPGSVQVFAQLGEIVLVGDLEPADRQAVLEVAGEVDGVRRVIDRLSL